MIEENLPYVLRNRVQLRTRWTRPETNGWCKVVKEAEAENSKKDSKIESEGLSLKAVRQHEW